MDNCLHRHFGKEFKKCTLSNTEGKKDKFFANSLEICRIIW